MLSAHALTTKMQDKVLISGITLDFEPGILYGVLGPNGSGKSTLLKTLAKIWTPSSGTVFWEGKDLHKKTRREISKTLSLVPQNTQLHFDFLVSDVVAMGRHPHQQADVPKELMRWALTTVDAWYLRDRSILSLSHGERQRIFIARALITESPILLLDEPASSLDIRHQLEIWNLMQELAKKGKVVIVTTHDIALTRRFCNQVVVMHEGVCAAKGNTKDVFTKELLAHVFGVEEAGREGFLLSQSFQTG